MPAALMPARSYFLFHLITKRNQCLTESQQHAAPDGCTFCLKLPIWHRPRDGGDQHTISMRRRQYCGITILAHLRSSISISRKCEESEFISQYFTMSISFSPLILDDIPF